jgi:hypothetical protein
MDTQTHDVVDLDDPGSTPARAVDTTGVVAGVAVLLGTLTVGIAVAVLAGAALDPDPAAVPREEWRAIGAVGAVVLTIVVLLAALFGGYVAGRLAGRRPALHGLLVGGVILVLIGGIAGTVVIADDVSDARRNIRDQGIPTSGSIWDDILIGVGVAVPLALLAGAAGGARRGASWYDRPAGHRALRTLPHLDEAVAAGRDDSPRRRRRRDADTMELRLEPPPGTRRRVTAADDARARTQVVPSGMGPRHHAEDPTARASSVRIERPRHGLLR